MRTSNRPFDPERHMFRKLKITGPEDLNWFERRLVDINLGDPDALRVNVYLTMDGTFTTLWHGVLDPFIAEHRLGLQDDPNFDLAEAYQHICFRGLIGDDCFGERVLEATRIMQMAPGILSMSEKHGLECRPLIDA